MNDLWVLVYSNPLVVDKIGKTFLIWKDSGFIFTRHLLASLPETFCFYWMIPDNIYVPKDVMWLKKANKNVYLIPYPYSTSILQNRYEFNGTRLRDRFQYGHDIDVISNNQPEVSANLRVWARNQRREEPIILSFFHWIDCKESRAFSEELGGYFWREYDGALASDLVYLHGEYAESLFRREIKENVKNPGEINVKYLLVERRAVALHRQEIFDRVWADVVVSDGALTQAIRTLRRTLGEDAERTFVRTVSRHGYQFVCPVVEEADDGTVPAPGDAPPEPASGDATDPPAAPLGRLLDPALEEDARREAAEELHALGTAEALRRLDRAPGHARAWAHLRDSRWDVAGAGSVPLFGPPARPAAWAALLALRLKRAFGRRHVAWLVRRLIRCRTGSEGSLGRPA